MRLALFLGLLVACFADRAHACSCSYVSPKRALASADVVFAGRVEEVIPIDPDGSAEERIIVRFRVARVWKGDVGAEFTMHTFFDSTMCIGLLSYLAVEGEESLVFASAGVGKDWKTFLEPSESEKANPSIRRTGLDNKPLRQDLIDAVPDGATIYSTDICSGTTSWEDAAPIVSQLGGYRTPQGAYTMHDAPAPAEEEVPAALRGLPHVCREVLQGSEWTESGAPPANSAALEDLLAADERYPYAEQAEFLDRWLREGPETLALCRSPGGDAEECDALAAVFELKAKDRGGWQLSYLANDSCKVAE
jgi:hypothetical protein